MKNSLHGRFLFDQDKNEAASTKLSAGRTVDTISSKEDTPKYMSSKRWDIIEVHCVCRMHEVSDVEMKSVAIAKLGTIFHFVFLYLYRLPRLEIIYVAKGLKYGFIIMMMQCKLAR